MRASLTPFLAVVAALFLLSAALADTLASTYAELRTEVQARLDQLPSTGITKAEKKVKSALTKARAALDHDASTLGSVVSDTGKLVAALDPTFPGDATLGLLLDPVLNDLRATIDGRIGTMASRVDALPEGDKVKVKVGGLAARALAALVPGDVGGAARSVRVKSFSNAVKHLVKGEKAVAKAFASGGSRVTTTTFVVDVDGQPLQISPTPVNAYTVTYDSGGAFLTIRAIGETPDGALHNIVFSIRAPGLGSRGVFVGSPYTSDAGTPVPPLTSMSGTVKLTSWRPETNAAAGTFEVTYGNGTETVRLTGGRFTTMAMQQ